MFRHHIHKKSLKKIYSLIREAGVEFPLSSKSRMLGLSPYLSLGPEMGITGLTVDYV